jgi:HlyD family secretion protein
VSVRNDRNLRFLPGGRAIRTVIIIAAMAAAFYVLYQQQQKPVPAIVSGILEGVDANLGSRVGGRVQKVIIREGQPVKAGQEILKLEAEDLVAKLAEARAQVPVTEAAYERLTKGFRSEEIAQARADRDQAKAAYDEAVAGPRLQEIKTARAAVAQATAELELAEANYRRAAALIAKGVTTPEKYDEATRGRKVATETARAREADLALLLEGTRKERIAQHKARLEQTQAVLDLRVHGNRQEDIAEAYARREAARSAVVTLQAQVRELSIYSPVDGYVEALDLQPGDLVAPGTPVLTVLANNILWFRCYAPQKYMSKVYPGSKLPIVFDALPDKTYEGVVSFVGAQAEFTPSNAQTPEERTKQVYRFKLDLPATQELHPGMTGTISLLAEARELPR